ncbi:MAG: putative NRPS-like protein biosynthetic cluster [Sarcosagium campestre]|nr:MAG: putative NRPS-like protein biosynthetic cluster [Sarcosagium campestre]
MNVVSILSSPQPESEKPYAYDTIDIPSEILDGPTEDTAVRDSVPRSTSSCVHHLFETQTILRPKSPSLCSWDGQLSYEELNGVSSRLAQHLSSLEIAREEYVAFAFEKSMWAVVSMMAILKAGGACLAVDPGHPKDRIQTILGAAQARIVLCSPSTAPIFDGLNKIIVTASPSESAKWPTNRSIDGVICDDLTPKLNGHCNGKRPYEQAAFVVFTSGTSGVPKGIVLEHQAVCTSAFYHGEAMGVNADSRVFQYAAYTFDMSIYDIFTTLIRGGCVCIPSEADRMQDLTAAMCRMEVNWAFFTPSMAKLLTPSDLPHLKTLLLAGEAVSQDILDVWCDHVRLINGYGSTECSTCVIGDLDRASSPNAIGQAAGVTTWIVDANDHNVLVQSGDVGELVVSGPVLARGYLDRNQEVTGAFLDSADWLPQDGGGSSCRLYKTGDIVRYAADKKSLEFIGRRGNMVKIRGQRVELEEIEQQISVHPSVAVSVASVPKEGFYAQKLVVTLSLDSVKTSAAPGDEAIKEVSEGLLKETQFDADDILRHLSNRLPTYMIPSVCIVVERIPSTSSGKVDRLRIDAWLRARIPPSVNTTGPACKSKEVSQNSDAAEDAIHQKVISTVTSFAPDAYTRYQLSRSDQSLSLSRAGFDSIKLIALSNLIKKTYATSIASKLLGALTPRQLAQQISKQGDGSAQITDFTSLDLSAEYGMLVRELLLRSTDDSSKPKTVFLTGGTGYLGTYIIRSLLQTLPPTSRIIVHARVSSKHVGITRLLHSANLAGYSLEPHLHRIKIWQGDLGKPLIGLTERKWRRLCGEGYPVNESIDAIIHNGAVVHWTADYKSLKAPNVTSTVLLLKAAAQSPVKPSFVYVSGGQSWSSIEQNDPAASLTANISALSGYDLTKRLSEFLVKEHARVVASRHQSATIVRPGFIIGDTDTGAANIDDYLWRVVAGAIDARQYGPEAKGADWLYVSPVTRVASAVVNAVLDGPQEPQSPETQSIKHPGNMVTSDSSPTCRIKNITDGIPVQAFWDVISNFGFELKKAPNAQDFISALQARVGAHGESHPLYPVLESLEQDGGYIGVERAETAEPESRVQQIIRDAVQKNVEYLCKVRFLPSPAGKQSEEAWGGKEEVESTCFGRSRGIQNASSGP